MAVIVAFRWELSIYFKVLTLLAHLKSLFSRMITLSKLIVTCLPDFEALDCKSDYLLEADFLFVSEICMFWWDFVSS
jgi:hypothetical protein